MKITSVFLIGLKCLVSLFCGALTDLPLEAGDVSGVAFNGQIFKDDFSSPNDAWRYGNAVLSFGKGSLPLAAHAPEATLSPTAVHPENLVEFRGVFRWNFGARTNREFRIGWGKPYEFSIDVGCTSNVFKRGHRIRLQVTSSNFPLWDPNPNTGGDPATETRSQSAQQSVFHDAVRPSRLVLPVVPARI